MRKKIINGLLLAVTFVAMSALVSCKDYESDYIAELQGQIDDQNYLLSTLKAQQIAALQTQVNDLQAQLDKLRSKSNEREDSLAAVTAKIEELLSKIKSCDCKPVDLQGIRDSIANLEKTKANLADMITADNLLWEAIKKLQDREAILTDSMGKVNQQALAATALASQAMELLKGKADTATVNALAATVDSLRGAVINLDNRLTKVEKDASDALAMAIRDSIRLDVVQKGLQDAVARLDKIEPALEQAQKDIEQNKKDIEQNAKDLADAKKKYDNALKVINEALASLQEQINNLANKEGLTMKEVQEYLTPIVNGLESKIKAVQDELDALKKQLNKAIDALVNKITSIELQGAESPVIGYFALPIGVKSNILAAYYGEPAANGGTGDVYFPSDRSASYVFSNQVISDEAFAVLGGKDIVTKTTYDKYIMDESEGNAGTLYLTINPAEVDFSGITPKLVNSRDVESGITLSPIAPSSKLLDFGWNKRAARVQNGFYEAKATLDPSKVEDVKPNFDINELKPLAKQILNEKEIDLTNIYYTIQGQLKDVLVCNGVKVEWEDTLGTHSVYSGYDIAATAIPALSFNFLADVEGPSITPLGALDIDVKMNLSYSSTGTIDYELGDIYVEVDGKKYNVQGLDGLNGLIAQLNDEHADLSGDINDLIDNIKEEVESNVDEAEDKIKNNNVVSKVSQYLKTINFFLQKPNNLLQPFLAYESEGAYHHMSMSPAIPTEFKTGTGNAIQLIPTSYTAEVLAPAFQKFIAVTNVIAPDFSVSAQSGDATCKELAETVNNPGNFMNTVIPGKQTGIVFAPDTTKKGYIYEITYAAVDYNGFNVARKFYVRVK